MNLSQADVIQLELPANHKYLNILSACLSALLERVEGLVEPTMLIYSVQLALQEACANIVDHAYSGQTGGRIEVTFTIEPFPRRLTIDLHDTGQPFEPEAVPAPDLDEVQVHGYGLFLMRTLLDEATYQSLPGHNYWHLVKNL